ncbi:MAG: hypothetical protein ACKN85_15270 [Pirellula sp.]
MLLFSSDYLSADGVGKGSRAMASRDSVSKPLRNPDRLWTLIIAYVFRHYRRPAV